MRRYSKSGVAVEKAEKVSLSCREICPGLDKKPENVELRLRNMSQRRAPEQNKRVLDLVRWSFYERSTMKSLLRSVAQLFPEHGAYYSHTKHFLLLGLVALFYTLSGNSFRFFVFLFITLVRLSAGVAYVAVVILVLVTVLLSAVCLLLDCLIILCAVVDQLVHESVLLAFTIFCFCRQAVSCLVCSVLESTVFLE